MKDMSYREHDAAENFFPVQNGSCLQPGNKLTLSKDHAKTMGNTEKEN